MRHSSQRTPPDACLLTLLLGTAAVLFAGSPEACAQLPPLPNDHLLGYKVGIDKKADPAGSAFPPGVLRSPVDANGTHDGCGIGKEVTLYTPADKNGEGIQDFSRHYVGYRIKCPTRTRTTATYFDQVFPAGIEVEISKVRSILVPSGKSVVLAPDPTPPAAGTNHYLCYKAKAASIDPVTVDVRDQFDAAFRSFELSKIQAVCNPADKDGDDPSAAGDPDHYLCYKAEAAERIDPPSVRTSNLNFGANTLAVKSTSELCIPAYRDSVPPTTSTTLGECGGGPFSCGGSCTSGLACAPIGDFPPYCGCVPDGSQDCTSVTWPYCNGVCSGGGSCGSTAHVPDSSCMCAPPGTTACGESDFPTCDGACPEGEGCFAFRISGGGYEFCGCAAEAACSSDCGSFAGGQCAPAQVCAVGNSPCGCTPE